MSQGRSSLIKLVSSLRQVPSPLRLLLTEARLVEPVWDESTNIGHPDEAGSRRTAGSEMSCFCNLTAHERRLSVRPESEKK
jgi:hypothetical protein